VHLPESATGHALPTSRDAKTTNSEALAAERVKLVRMTACSEEKAQSKRWRRAVGLAFMWVTLWGCESRYSATPANAPEVAASDASAKSIEELLAAMHPDAGQNDAQAVDTSHAMIVSTCASSTKPCSAAVADAALSNQYFVVFGSGRGVVRSRDQALTDLYEELRNRMEAGERLDVRSGASSASTSSGRREQGQPQTSTASGGQGETVIRCAFRLLGLVDEVGQVTLDIVHGMGDKACLVSLERSRSTEASQCLIQAPERPHRPGGKGGLSF
jgi:hypothetical protein